MKPNVKLDCRTGLPAKKQKEWNQFFKHQLVHPALARIRQQLPIKGKLDDKEVFDIVVNPERYVSAEFMPIFESLLNTMKGDVAIVRHHVLRYGKTSHAC